MALAHWSKRKRIGWLIAAVLVAILAGCGVVGLFSDRTGKPPIIWFHNDNSPSGVG
jgi:hypothetical protein